MKIKSKSTLASKFKNPPAIAIFVLAFGVVGTVILLSSHAATPTAAFQAEADSWLQTPQLSLIARPEWEM
jgi:hypothetical protein